MIRGEEKKQKYLICIYISEQQKTNTANNILNFKMRMTDLFHKAAQGIQ